MAANEVRMCIRAFLSQTAQYQRRLGAFGSCILRTNVTRNGIRASLCKVGAAGLSFATALPFVPTVNAAMWGTKQDTKWEPKNEEERVIKEADDFYDKNNYIELYELLVKYKDCNNDEILWRLARAACDMGKNASRSRHHEYMLEAFEYVKRALEINENNFACHKWYAILLDYTKTYEGQRARIESAYECKKHLEKAIELNPGDATTIHSLGYWCYLFADMPWYQRKIASAIFATPPASTYEEALKYFERAEEVSPNFFSLNLLYLAKTYYALGDKEKALHYATKTREYYMKTSDDIQAHTEACQLLAKLGVKLDTKKD